MKPTKIMRISVHAFLQSYNSFASVAALLVFPVSISVLLSQALTSSSSSSLPFILSFNNRIRSLFDAAGFPTSSQFFALLNLKLSQTIFSFVVAFPSSVTFLALAKASVIQTIHEYPLHKMAPPPLSSSARLYCAVLATYLVNSFIIFSANAAVFSLLFVALNLADLLGLSSSYSYILALSAFGAIIYSVVLASTLVVCNLATIVSAVENSGGFLAVLKACLLMRGRSSTAVTLAFPANLCMAGVEALFQYRVVKPYLMHKGHHLAFVGEGFTIIYMYSILIVLDVIMGYIFYKSCKLRDRSNSDGYDHQTELEPDD